jgi:hypothetical protein
MKALSLIALTLSAFLIFLGISSRATAGILSNALIIGGAIIASFLAIVWIVWFVSVKNKKES